MVGSLNDRLGAALRRARVTRHLTLRDVGTRSNGRFSPTTIAGYERGERAVSVPRFCELAGIYGVRPDRLLREALGDAELEEPVLDLTVIEGLAPSAAHLLRAFVDRVVDMRRESGAGAITLRAGDLEILAGRTAERQ